MANLINIDTLFSMIDSAEESTKQDAKKAKDNGDELLEQFFAGALQGMFICKMLAHAAFIADLPKEGEEDQA